MGANRDAVGAARRRVAVVAGYELDGCDLRDQLVMDCAWGWLEAAKGAV